MKKFQYIFAFVVLSLSALTTNAQPQKSRLQGTNTGSRTQAASRKTTGAAQAGSSRAELMFPTAVDVPEEVVWRRDIYRTIDLTEAGNAALYYPTTPIGKQVNLFTLLFQLINQGKIAVYRYNTDGLENFTQDNRMHFKEMLDRYTIPYEAAGNTIKVDAIDIPSNEVLSYYVKESSYYDQNTATYHSRVTALCPVLHRADEFSIDPVKYPLFWVKYDDISTYLSGHTLMISDLNNAAEMSMADFFATNKYKGKIYMTTNMQGKTLQEYCPTDSLLDNEQARIEKEMKDFEEHIWAEPVDSVELARQDSIAQANTKTKKGLFRSKKSKSTATASTEKASKKTSEKKAKSSGSATPRVSVRRQRH
ncbi:MAG: gliding motility protein GldN [Bacteroidaceae bacterium]|nr:gliding motility protein GldN [Bacteroidaceae bacterium]